MKCPVDSVDLVMSERGGVEIDYCPQCRGVWLDRGELDKIIDRSESFGAPGGAAAASAPAPVAPPAPAAQVPPPLYHLEPRSGERRPDERRYDDRNRDDRRDRPRYDQPRYDDRRRPKKKEGWLGELFDF